MPPVQKSTKLKPRRFHAVRATRLDGCGRVVYGDGNTATSEGVITATLATTTTEVAAIEGQTGTGRICISEPAETVVTGHTAEIEFCEVDPEFFELVTGQPVIRDSEGKAIGIAEDLDTDLRGHAFGIELWAGGEAGDVCDNPDAEGSFVYFLLPFAKGGTIGDITLENDAISFTVTGIATRKGSRWGVGPYPVVIDATTGLAGPLASPVSRGLSRAILQTAVAPPVDTIGARPVLDPALPALTDIDAVAEPAPSLVIDVTVDADPDEYVWWDFGDTGWAYELGGTIEYEYEEAGTYEVRASRNGAWVTTTVTVPASGS